MTMSKRDRPVCFFISNLMMVSKPDQASINMPYPVITPTWVCESTSRRTNS